MDQRPRMIQTRERCAYHGSTIRYNEGRESRLPKRTLMTKQDTAKWLLGMAAVSLAALLAWWSFDYGQSRYHWREAHLALEAQDEGHTRDIHDCFVHRASAPPDSGFERFEYRGCFDRVQEYASDETRGRIRWPQ